MKLVKKAQDICRFKCKYCNNTYEAYGSEFEFVKRGILRYRCPVCKCNRIIKEKDIKVVENFKEVVFITQENLYLIG